MLVLNKIGGARQRLSKIAFGWILGLMLCLAVKLKT